MANLTFAEQCELDWKKILKSLFSTDIPSLIEWTNQNDIIKVLKVIGTYGHSNHMFFPDGGGMDLEGAKKSHEPGCIELDCGLTYVIKIKLLQFNHFEGNEIWDYFRIEADNLKPVGSYKNAEYSEEITELTPGEYVERSAWENNEYNGNPLPIGARVVIRLLKGSLVIFSKDSIYNHDTSTYDGRHDKLSAEDFRKYIEREL